MSALLLYCRPGFEKECMAEISELAGTKEAFGWANIEMNSGFVIFECETAHTLYSHCDALVFARDVWPISDRLTDLDPSDRLSPIIESVKQLMAEKGIKLLGDVSTEHAEGDDYRATAKFAGKFVHPVRQALRKLNLLSKKEDSSKPSLRLFFKDSTQVIVGSDKPRLRAKWPMGIARLRSPAAAPSRSTLKLEEAFGHFLGDDWREQLSHCRTGVDLGASPGGWTWQLVNQGLYTYAIDNGPMDKKLMASGLVEHVAADGFTWKPPLMVDWLVCDMIEKPGRVAQLMYEWLHTRQAKYAIFNLKLPMKKRFQEWQDIKTQLDIAKVGQHPKAIMKAKHLYHDREEITVFLDLGNQNG
ncbi:23S rRNA (cytidine(2498)-2'-O)-methyltransferase RlmM [Reinekea sp.]|jgi:23S rRNA (cytidine2498-2'-O)-methyltransferase|uniref:23S rRNA (cytidine(2498)-2'-O)-methyltransferase RlmM n=1 Tax=Reinekea sp. TaxID=1970455 RepID=UPI00398A49DD